MNPVMLDSILAGDPVALTVLDTELYCAPGDWSTINELDLARPSLTALKLLLFIYADDQHQTSTESTQI